MSKYDNSDFLHWMEKSKITEHDIIDCRKMQSSSLTETENTFGITTISVCGFINNDVVRLGGDIKQHYDESKEAYYERVYRILIICCELMDDVNEVIADEGAWSPGHFVKKLNQWKESKGI
ncbi:MAG: hypothetical protein PUB52_09570 [Lachnospiraceae bacterium]|nr:hypothetical protein [Lachnospiraceae bacterium]